MRLTGPHLLPVTMFLGSFAWSSVFVSLIGALLVTSSVCLAAFATANSVWLYGGLRFLQVLSIAPVFPLVVVTMREAGARA